MQHVIRSLIDYRLEKELELQKIEEMEKDND